MATRNNIVKDIAKLATEVAKRDLKPNTGDINPEIILLIASVTEQIKQRSGDNRQLKELVAMIDASMPSVTSPTPTANRSPPSQ